MKLVIILIVVLVLAIGGGGVWFFMFRDVDAPVEEVVEMPPDPIFIALEPLSMHVIRGGGVRKYIVLKITLEMLDEESRALAENKMPKLRDVFIGAINEYYSNLPSLDESVNVKAVKKRLIAARNRAIGVRRLTGVLVQGVLKCDARGDK